MADGHPIHEAAARGFEQNAAEYELGRPGYPAEAVAYLVDRLELGPGRTVMDVGAGTGKLTRELIPSGASVQAVEPVAAMRAQLLSVVPGAVVHDATADRLPCADASVDAIVCAQAFHWFATPQVLAEFARALRPHGPLAVVYNVRDNSVAWVRRFSDVVRPYEGDRPDHNRGAWQEVFAGDSPFTPLTKASFRHEHAMTPDLLVARAASLSFIGALPEATRAEVLDRVRELGVEQGPSFALPYRTDVYLTTRR